MIYLFIFFLIFLIVILIFLYKKRFKGYKNVHTLEQAVRHFNKLPHIDSPEARKELREMLEKTSGHKLSDEEFEEAFKKIKKETEKLFKSETK